jgi:gamma-glutamyltranspeptidase/glutathione hydrolase
VASHHRPGDLTESDLAGYRAIAREPLCSAYRVYRVCGMPPPSSGGVAVLQILGILERTRFAQAAPNSAEAVHLFSEAARLAYADRARYIADPAFAPQPLAGLLAPGYLAERAALVGARSMGAAPPGIPRGALAWSDPGLETSAGTSHISVVDAEGNAVAMTTSIEYAFGSRIFVRGFLLNNQLTDFAFVPEQAGRLVANRVEPGKRPRSSMTPTIVFDRAGQLQMVLGSPGGPGIINYVAKTLVATLDWGLNVQDAIASPNFGSTNGPTLIERGTPYEELGDALAERGHILNFTRLTSGLHGIERIPGGWRAGADPRREGVARGQ